MLTEIKKQRVKAVEKRVQREQNRDSGSITDIDQCDAVSMLPQKHWARLIICPQAAKAKVRQKRERLLFSQRIHVTTTIHFVCGKTEYRRIEIHSFSTIIWRRNELFEQTNATRAKRE